MTHQPTAGAVIYVKDISRMCDYYVGVFGFVISRRQRDNIALELPAMQLILVAMPESIASQINITTPPAMREDTPIKLILPVPSLSDVRARAAQLGGGLNDREREWTFQGRRVCDGFDPEGNVVQCCEIAQ